MQPQDNELPQKKRIQEIYKEQLFINAAKTDKMFAFLFGIQWILGIIFALVISPKTWIGEYNQVHLHVYAAIFLGGLIASLPIFLTLRNPGATLNRYIISISQILFSILFIHLTGGRIETHFHVFGSLAFIAFYRDWKLLLLTTLITATDHLLRGIFWPESVYGVILATPWRALEHSAWVLFEDVFLMLSIQRSLEALSSISEKQAYLERNVITIESEVLKRTQELEESKQKILDQQKTLITSAKMSALGEMAGGMAHEINNPLAIIKTISSQIEDFANEPAIDMRILGEMASTLVRTTDRIAAIIQGLKSFSSNDSQLPFKLINIRRLIEETLIFCQERFRLHEINLSVKQENLYLGFEGRSIEISQVLLNLLNNAHEAVAHLPNKWVEIEVSDNNTWIEIRITDSGNGIPRDIHDKIFQPFFTTKEVGLGTGLGLSISQGIIHSHGGELKLEGDKVNTCFLIRLQKNKTQEQKQPYNPKKTNEPD